MIIDFHTHTFPDPIAAKTIAYLAQKGSVTPYREGTLSSLKESMSRAGIDWSVVLPVATAPRQIPSINRLGASLNGKDGILYAGAIHPDCDNIEEILDFVKDSGMFGIKIHPDYQGVPFHDDRYLRILEGAAKRGLYIVTHAGVDVAYPNDVHCTPEMILYVLDALCGVIDNKLILAHLGGCDIPDQVLEKLIGTPVYMDTAVVLNRYPKQAAEIIHAHGANRILFATDSPWADQNQFIRILRSFGLSDQEQTLIFEGNARNILAQAGIFL